MYIICVFFLILQGVTAVEIAFSLRLLNKLETVKDYRERKNMAVSLRNIQYNLLSLCLGPRLVDLLGKVWNIQEVRL